MTCLLRMGYRRPAAEEHRRNSRSSMDVNDQSARARTPPSGGYHRREQHGIHRQTRRQPHHLVARIVAAGQERRDMLDPTASIGEARTGQHSADTGGPFALYLYNPR